MFRKFFSLVVIGLWGVFVIPLTEKANAAIPLTKAEIQDLRNLVQLMRLREPKRKARKQDAMTPGDGLSTGRASLADLRFNDGSLARVGEQAVFRFLPQTRNFRLSNGTVLLVIPPGQGQTRINTPSAAAAIRGSALFMRYDQATDTTIVGALTNSGIQVYDQNDNTRQELQAGQLMVIVKGKFKGLYDFDLRTFYDTSDLVRGLDLPLRGKPSSDPAIAQVQQETAAAVASQKPIVGQGVVENPSFVKLTAGSTDSSTSNNNARDNTPVNTFLETGQVFSNPEKQPLPITGTDKPLEPSKPSESLIQPSNPPSSVTPPTEPSKPLSESPIKPSTPPLSVEPITPATPLPSNNQPPTNGTPITPPSNNQPPTNGTPITPPSNNQPPTNGIPITPPSNNQPPTNGIPITPPSNNQPPTNGIPITPPSNNQPPTNGIPITPLPSNNQPPTNGNTTNPLPPVTPPTQPPTTPPLTTTAPVVPTGSSSNSTPTLTPSKPEIPSTSPPATLPVPTTKPPVPTSINPLTPVPPRSST